MSVPSRSRKTAGQLSLDEPVIFKTGEQFGRRHRCRAEFADNDSAGVIGEVRGLDSRGVADKSEGEQSDCGIARARDVKDLARFCRNMVRLLAPLEKHHALLAQRDQQKLALPFL